MAGAVLGPAPGKREADRVQGLPVASGPFVEAGQVGVGGQGKDVRAALLGKHAVVLPDGKQQPLLRGPVEGLHHRRRSGVLSGPGHHRPVPEVQLFADGMRLPGHLHGLVHVAGGIEDRPAVAAGPGEFGRNRPEQIAAVRNGPPDRFYGVADASDRIAGRPVDVHDPDRRGRADAASAEDGLAVRKNGEGPVQPSRRFVGHAEKIGPRGPAHFVVRMDGLEIRQQLPVRPDRRRVAVLPQLVLRTGQRVQQADPGRRVEFPAERFLGRGNGGPMAARRGQDLHGPDPVLPGQLREQPFADFLLDPDQRRQIPGQGMSVQPRKAVEAIRLADEGQQFPGPLQPRELVGHFDVLAPSVRLASEIPDEGRRRPRPVVPPRARQRFGGRADDQVVVEADQSIALDREKIEGQEEYAFCDWQHPRHRQQFAFRHAPFRMDHQRDGLVHLGSVDPPFPEIGLDPVDRD